MRKLVTEGLNNLPKSDNWKVVKPGYKLGARAWCSAFSEARSWGSYVCGLCAVCVCPGRDGGAGAGGVLFWMREEHESVK